MSLYDREITLGETMKRAGYVTGAIGKWGVGSPPPVDDPARNGFDFFYGYINMWHAHNFYPEFLYRNGIREALPGNRTLLIDGQNPWADQPEGTGVAEEKVTYVHHLFDEEALDFITANRDTNFFLYLAYNVPHANNEAGSMFHDGMEVPDYGEFAALDWPSPEKGFASMIRNLDNSVGMINDCLDELGLAHHTLVIFISDNGPHEEGNHRVDFFNSNGHLRGKKRDLYEGGIRTPFIAKWPQKIQPGSRSDHLSGFWDFLPTFCDLAGMETPGNTDGISFLPAMTGNPGDQKTHPYLYWEFYEQGGKQAVRKGDWKGIRLDVRSGDPRFELYDLSKDPAEEINVAERHPEIVRELLRIMDTSHTPIPEISLFSLK
jgi:arylsulfatase A-like enzyme